MQVADFSDMVNSGFTLLRIILGDFQENLQLMITVQPVLGPTYFLSYVLVIFFILLVRSGFFSSSFVSL